MLNKEYEILKPFIEEAWKKFTFKEIKKLSKKKSESYVYNSLKKFVKQNLLYEEKAGNVLLYTIKLSNLKTQIYAGFVAEHIAWHKKQIPYKSLQNIASKIPTDFFILIITGSYAKNKQKKDSDIDVVVISDDCFESKKIYAELKHDCEMSIPQIHLYVFKKSEFLDMLLEEKANYGKEITKNNLILSGGKEYYKIVSKAIKNGFNG